MKDSALAALAAAMICSWLGGVAHAYAMLYAMEPPAQGAAVSALSILHCSQLCFHLVTAGQRPVGCAYAAEAVAQQRVPKSAGTLQAPATAASLSQQCETHDQSLQAADTLLLKHTEEHRLLSHEADLRSQPAQVERPDVHAVQPDAAPGDVVPPLYQGHHSGFACSST